MIQVRTQFLRLQTRRGAPSTCCSLKPVSVVAKTFSVTKTFHSRTPDAQCAKKLLWKHACCFHVQIQQKVVNQSLLLGASIPPLGWKTISFSKRKLATVAWGNNTIAFVQENVIPPLIGNIKREHDQ